ncbi:aminopeptidase P family protein [Oceanirhabdus sp. W0125-5]|uniref:aminopeptidase P family protein n=1 Tax=Oceanirhabdus sp. W0125-5 TaxID=2999116 RepID=UPI0022F32F9E|nr:aminopeptidase P family protein [Oceanirhabdus sp. W0125-5]WBW97962.1 aminopeptidase P family protein [Oceanirhabdus sp. W0125-5]
MEQSFFINNRNKLSELIEDNSLLVMFAGSAPFKTADEKYAFTPNRNFYYLTGINEEKIILTIAKVNGQISETLFIERFDPIMAKWVGATISEEEAYEKSGIRTIKNIDEFEGYIGSTMNRMPIEQIYFDLERQSINTPLNKQQIFAKDIKEKYPHIIIKNVFNQISSLRLIKTEDEIKNIQKAIGVTKEGIELMMKNAQPGMKEYELEAYFDFTLTRNGIRDKAFKTIAAAGKNATILHYDKNNSEIKDGDLVLFDLGAQYGYYSADISRTFPANGKFTDRQKDVYNAVLKAQKAVEEAVKPGVPFMELNEICKKVLAEECIKLGLIEDEKEIGKYFFHTFGHYMGLDTHDVGSRSIALEEGMVITNEPGLYIEEECIGIRIEDDLLVTKDGCVNLSKDIIKEVDEIEAFMANR